MLIIEYAEIRDALGSLYPAPGPAEDTPRITMQYALFL